MCNDNLRARLASMAVTAWALSKSAIFSTRAGLSVAETQHSENFARSHGCCNLPDAEVLIAS
jgi:hypothetical protein